MKRSLIHTLSNSDSGSPFSFCFARTSAYLWCRRMLTADKPGRMPLRVVKLSILPLFSGCSGCSKTDCPMLRPFEHVKPCLLNFSLLSLLQLPIE